jgi:phage terminase large subunit-like protein
VKTKRQKPRDPVEAYALAVVAGTIVAGRLVRLACERHLKDLATAHARGLRWDWGAASHAIEFFGFLKHSKGEWAGKTLELAPWQVFIVGVLFGWKRLDGTRRFRMAYDEIARKNGKSTMAAGIALYLAFFSGEMGADCYTAATKRDQARIVHGEAVRMVKASPELRARIKICRDNLSNQQTNSKYEPLGKDADTIDGLNPSGVIIDELHAHKNRDMLDVLETGTGSRREPLIFVITTAGVAGQPSVCSEMHDYAEKVLVGQIEDDSFFAFIAAIDEGDDWTDEACWPKANPNLGISCKLDDLRRKALKAKEMPSALASFLQKHLNRWVQSLEVWLPDDVWMSAPNAKPVSEEALAGENCFCGLDLANTLDLCALARLFPRGAAEKVEPQVADDTAPAVYVSDRYELLMHFWIPESKAEEREKSHRANFRSWIQQGLVIVTDGDVTDFDVVRADIARLATQCRVVKLAFDPFNARQLSVQLGQDGIDCAEFTQSIRNYNEPMMLLEKLAREGRITHGANPLMRWMVGNVVAIRNGLGQTMPSRKKSKDKIDGVAALLMALSAAIAQPASATPSVEWI